jgi:uncharacterized protein (TIRG00374 family)
MRKKLKMKKSTKFSLIFMGAVLVLTICSVLKGERPQDVLREIRAADGRYLLLAVLSVLAYVMLQGVVIYLMCRALDMKESLRRCLLMAFHGYFFCNITPMQSGGPAIQIYDMKKEGITMPIACMIVFNMTFLFKAVLFVVTVLLVIFGRGLIHTYMGAILPFLIFGIVLTIVFTILIGLLIFHTKLTKKLAIDLLLWAEEHRLIRHRDGRVEKWSGLLDQYKDTAGFFLTHKRLMAGLFLLTFVQRFCFFSSTYFVYRSFGLAGESWLTVCLLQASINIIADLLPIPGGAGVSEAAFLAIFRKVFHSYTKSGLLLTRGITYYAQLVICGMMTVVAMITFSLDRTRMGKFKKTNYDPAAVEEELYGGRK